MPCKAVDDEQSAIEMIQDSGHQGDDHNLAKILTFSCTYVHTRCPQGKNDVRPSWTRENRDFDRWIKASCDLHEGRQIRAEISAAVSLGARKEVIVDQQ
jgi:hypothetical protein